MRQIPLADSLDDPRVIASRDLMAMRFAAPEGCELALRLLEYYSARAVVEGACQRLDATTLRWLDAQAFALAVDELDDFEFKLAFPKAERMAWIASLTTGPYRARLFRGERSLRPEGFASDPGDLGTGRYLTSCPVTAQNYGTVGEHEVVYARAAQAQSKEVVDVIELFYRTVRGNDRIGGADRMRADFLEAGIEALIVEGYDSPKGQVTVVEFTSAPPRPVSALEDEPASFDLAPPAADDTAPVMSR